MIPVIRIRSVEHDGDFRLRLKFSDGTGGLADLAKLVAKKPLSAVRKCFAKAAVVDGAVEWPNGEDIATETLYALAHGLPRPRTLEDVVLQQDLVALKELRRKAGMTILKVSDSSKMDAGEVSRFERRDDHRVSTLRRYVEALGGELEIYVVMGGKRTRIG
jgi:hypothetical protein